MTMRLLLIEDDRDAAGYLVKALTEAGYRVDHAADGRDGLFNATEHAYDGIIADRMLPHLDGLTIVEVLRKQGNRTPVLILSALGSVDHRVEGLRAGGDDYLTKPFALSELEVRVEAIVARARGMGRRRVLAVADLALDLDTLEVRRAGQLLQLYPACRRLLEVLLRASPGVVTRAELERTLWGDAPPDGDLLRSHVYELRRAVDGPFEQKLVHTASRVGYRIALPGGDPP